MINYEQDTTIIKHRLYLSELNFPDNITTEDIFSTMMDTVSTITNKQLSNGYIPYYLSLADDIVKLEYILKNEDDEVLEITSTEYVGLSDTQLNQKVVATIFKWSDKITSYYEQWAISGQIGIRKVLVTKLTPNNQSAMNQIKDELNLYDVVDISELNEASRKAAKKTLSHNASYGDRRHTMIGYFRLKSGEYVPSGIPFLTIF